MSALPNQAFQAPHSRTLSLDQLELRVAAIVDRVDAPASAPEWADWLAELGFMAGEPVQILTRAMPGADPLMVRIGDSTFALRKAEAACVRIRVSTEVPALHLKP